MPVHSERLQKLLQARQLAELCAKLDIPLGDASSPGQLATLLDPNNQVQRPHLEVIDDALTHLLATPQAQLMIWTPSQVGKSTRVSVYFPFWWMTKRPRDRILNASAEERLARRNGSAVRALVQEFGPAYGLNLVADEGSKADWAIRAGGSLRSRGLRGNFTGQPMDLGIIDDPFISRAQAESLNQRDFVWDWYSSVWSQRKSPTYREVLVMCMTGDTPVLMADGTEKPLRDVRPGDEIATYDNGRLSTSVVRNWANQGSDSIYRIKMKSGREVRANARHPFLTIDENGNETWKRTHTLEPGNAILGIGENGETRRAPRTTATNPPSAEGCARRTTTNSDGPKATDGVHPRSDARHECATATASPPKSTTRWSPHRMAAATSAAMFPTAATPTLTGAGNSASTTTTKQAVSAGCCAMTATSPLDMAGQPIDSARPLTTWTVTPDEVVSVEPCGIEDVFDVQVDRTENFIANGLVSHNTRWHEDDLAGRLLARDGRVEDGGKWIVVHLPAIAMLEDRVRGIYADPLGRAPGEPLTHPLLDPDDVDGLLAWWAQKRAMSTARDWAAMSQGVPSDATTALLSENAIRTHTKPAPVRDDLRRVVIGVDPSGGEGEKHDSVGIAVAGIDGNGTAWVLDDKTDTLGPMEWPRRVCLAAHQYQAGTIVYEKNYGGGMTKVLIQQAWADLQREGDIPASENCPHVSGVSARVSKVLRAEPIAQAVLTDRVYFAQLADLTNLTNEWRLWQPGSTWSPGALDANVYALTEVLPPVNAQTEVSRPTGGRQQGARGSGQFAGVRRRAS
ncbi:terminase [Gordonia phage Keitabear]|uniref:Terminase n=1 Tax=Gordonia phage Keitabear TaxID=2653274 RepID=A0A5P8D603_9CAUD|nr:terminase large subunit [Gordonia phage Keitabear]QFP94444.1 terminase [Gordonia phage Keitabear]QWT30132.1 terminase [Gordonia phage Sedona]